MDMVRIAVLSLTAWLVAGAILIPLFGDRSGSDTDAAGADHGRRPVGP